jgi:hypothetical protein
VAVTRLAVALDLYGNVGDEQLVPLTERLTLPARLNAALDFG